MAELKKLRRSKQVAPATNGWLLDVEADDTQELDLDPFGGRFCSDQLDYEYEDADFDSRGGYHGLFGL
jgi:hypothetical protein